MKKKICFILAAVLVLAVLFVPIPGGIYKDGGTREFCALTYKIVNWRRLTTDGVYQKTKVYFFPDNFRSIDELWENEEPQVENKFLAQVLEILDGSVIVQPLQEPWAGVREKISFDTGDLADIGAVPGSLVQVVYTESVMETYPAQIRAVRWELSGNLRNVEYTEQWMDTTAAEPMPGDTTGTFVITRIYANCFFARNALPMPYEYKINGRLSEEWCVGDEVVCTYENAYHDPENFRIQGDLLTVEASEMILGREDQLICYKPVIYLYPETETEVTVRLSLNGKLTCTYPVYRDGWTVTAAPDGTLTDGSGKTYNYLYWEGDTAAQWDMERGFCVKGEDTAAFLEDALARLGLTRREANEFIVYWLPLMEKNPYNVLSFQTDAYTEAAQLSVTPAPDTLIRVFMTWRASEDYVNLKAQTLTAPERTGFTLVEWGGTEVK